MIGRLRIASYNRRAIARVFSSAGNSRSSWSNATSLPFWVKVAFITSLSCIIAGAAPRPDLRNEAFERTPALSDVGLRRNGCGPTWITGGAARPGCRGGCALYAWRSAAQHEPQRDA